MKRKLMIDMDDVICSGGFLKLVNQFLGTNYTEKDVPGYYVQSLIPDEKKEEYLDFFMQKNMYDYCDLHPFAVEIIKELNEEFEAFIGTSYIIPKREAESGIILYHKHNYLQENLPFINPLNYVFVGNKDILNCYVKIDDKLENLKNAKRKLLYTAYHNKYIDDNYLENNNIERVDNWPAIRQKLLTKIKK